MKVFKFGGASVNSVEAVKNLCTILKRFPDEKLMVVISAMGKTTNALEEVLNAYYSQASDPKELFKKVKHYHNVIITGLFPENNESVCARVESFYQQLESKLKTPSSESYDYEYDQIVPYGELISTTIISEYLNANGIENQWLDARNLIITDYIYRDAGVNWEKTSENVSQKAKEVFSTKSVALTQGFIGASPEKYITTLGREGTDYTAPFLDGVWMPQKWLFGKMFPACSMLTLNTSLKPKLSHRFPITKLLNLPIMVPPSYILKPFNLFRIRTYLYW